MTVWDWFVQTYEIP